MNLDNIYIHQVEAYGLGNFINLTPTIKLMADHFDNPIQVYFDIDFIRDCFIDCEFMDILDEAPDYNPFFTSGLVNFRNNCPDYIHVYREITKAIPLSGQLPHTYVDEARESKVESYNVLFIRGSGREGKMYLDSKMPYDEYYLEHMKGKCAFTGSENDKERLGDLFTWHKGDKIGYEMPMHVGDIRKSLALIREADYVVANDSGLAHAAAAMNKRMTILWKNTSLPKNANPNKNCLYKMCH